MAEKIQESNILKEYKQDMQRYTIYVSRKRVTPSLLDGLKPVQRRILFTSFNDTKSITRSAAVKSASIVGQTMAKYHPHGDAAIYGAFKPMNNWFEIKQPLMTGEGNYGNFQGDIASSSRYTESYLTKFAMDCVIGDMKTNKQVADWIPTYDEKNLEPEYLPVKLPLLLINGSFGIGVGMKVDIPTHNLREVIDATITLLRNPDAFITLIPDHCMETEIFEADYSAISNTGFGSYKIRGIIEVGEFNNRPALFIKSTPNLTFLDTVTEKIEELVKANKIIQIDNVFDQSEIDQMNYVIILKKGADPNYVRDVIYKNTDMEQNCRVNFEVLDGINPRRMSYKSYILSFIEFRKNVKYRLYTNELQKIQTRKHEIEAYVKLLKSGDIDNTIKLIRKLKNTDTEYMIEYLIKKLNITDLQAKYILNINLSRLAEGILPSFEEELGRCQTAIDILFNKILDEDYIAREIEDELLEIRKTYGKPRLSKLITNVDENDIPKGEFKVVVSNNNFIRKIPLNSNAGHYKNDQPKRILTVDNTKSILIFDELGRAFKIPVHKIPFNDKGTDIRFLLRHLTSNINTIIYEPDIFDLNDKVYKFYLVVTTAKGFIKKMDLADFLSIPTSGLVYVRLEEGDTVVSVQVVGHLSDIVIYSDKKALRIPVEHIQHLKRITKGARVFNSDNKVDGVSFINPSSTHLLVVTNNGYINKFDITNFPVNMRSKTGYNVIKLKKTDRINNIFALNDEDIIRITTNVDVYDVPVSSIASGSTIGPGVKMFPSLKGQNILRCDVIKNNI